MAAGGSPAWTGRASRASELTTGARSLYSASQAGQAPRWRRIAADGCDTWAALISVNLTNVAQVRFVAADGQTTMVAYLNAQSPWGSG